MANKKNVITAEERMTFIGVIRKPIINPLISDWKSHEMTLEDFIGHVFISGMLLQKNIDKETK